MSWDVFISYAGEDRREVAQPMATELERLGFKVWFANRILKVGDSLRSKIDEGLADSRYGIVIMSRSFFKKHWPLEELDGLAARQAHGRTTILPVVHRMKPSELSDFSPTLAGKIYIDTEKGINVVCQKLAEVLSSVTLQLHLDPIAQTVLDRDTVLRALQDGFRMVRGNQQLTFSVSIDSTLLTQDLFSRLKALKGKRMGGRDPEVIHEKAMGRTNQIFGNLEFLVGLMLSQYCNSVNDPQMILTTIQRACKLCVWDCLRFRARLLPEGKIPRSLYKDFRPLWDMLSKSSKQSYDPFTKAGLLEIGGSFSIVDLVGRRRPDSSTTKVEDVTRLCIPDSAIQTETQNVMAWRAHLSPDAEIDQLSWIGWFLPQILYYHAVNAAGYEVSLRRIVRKVGLHKSDYSHIGFS